MYEAQNVTEVRGRCMKSKFLFLKSFWMATKNKKNIRMTSVQMKNKIDVNVSCCLIAFIRDLEILYKKLW